MANLVRRKKLDIAQPAPAEMAEELLSAGAAQALAKLLTETSRSGSARPARMPMSLPVAP